MSQQTLMLVEATGIQDYIFASNQLRQNIGASQLVEQATTEWVYEALPSPHNVRSDEIEDRSLRADELAAEVVYAGGGNAMILFANDGEAYQFAKKLTRRVLEQAPGLQLVLKRKSFDLEGDVLADVHEQLRAELAQRKLDRPPSVPLLGLGVTAACVYTGAPAVDTDPLEGRLISAEVRAKLEAWEEGERQLKAELGEVEAAGYAFVRDFGDFGTPGESSYLAVIHADGNRMGQRIKAIGSQHRTPGDNEAYILALRRFSRSVRKAAETALKRTVGVLLDPENVTDGKFGGVVPIRERDGQELLPFRPIVFGGDDVTFVCDGRLGLVLANNYLAGFSAQILDDGKPAHARGGVAVVRSHYPFSRAYGLADALCQSAKEYILDVAHTEGLTALDWHFAVGGLVLPLKQVREREYGAQAGSLLMRPIRLTDPQGDWRSWETLQAVMEEFRKPQQVGGKWAGRRNKVLALRDALRHGPEAVKLFLYGEALPDVPQMPEMKTQGWQGGRCGYWDAIEALDFYVPLKGV